MSINLDLYNFVKTVTRSREEELFKISANVLFEPIIITAPIYSTQLTPLEKAARDGDIESIKAILDSMPDAETKYNLLNSTTHGITPLAFALITRQGSKMVDDNRSLVDYLLEEGADPNLPVLGFYPLNIAMENFDNSSFISLVNHPNIDLSIRDLKNADVLTRAIKLHNFEQIGILLGKAVPITNADIGGWTPLHYAVFSFNTDLVKTLIGAGADIHATTNTGLKPIHVAAYVGVPEIIEALAEGTEITETTADGYNLLHLAVGSNNLEFINHIINKGLSVSSKTLEGNTPLHLAAAKGNPDIIQRLLDLGADINAKNAHGETPLSFAAAGGDINTFQYLIEKGASVSDVPTILGDAALSGQYNMFASLMTDETMQHLDDVDGLGRNALHKAVIGNSLYIVRSVLMSKNISLNLKDQYGLTPLHYAAWKGDGDIIDTLIKKGAFVNVADGMDNTPLFYALGNLQSSAAVKQLIQARATLTPEMFDKMVNFYLDAHANITPTVADAFTQLKAVLLQEQYDNETLHAIAHSGFNNLQIEDIKALYEDQILQPELFGYSSKIAEVIEVMLL